MEQADFTAIVRSVFKHSPTGSDDLSDTVSFTEDGLLAIAAEDSGTIGFGVASGIAVNAEVLSTVETLTRQMNFGRYWLAPGVDADDYALVCGFTFPYEATACQQVIDLAVALTRHHRSLADEARQRLAGTTHSAYWTSDAPSEAQARMLSAHLG